MDFIERDSEFILRADIPGVHKVGSRLHVVGSAGQAGAAPVAVAAWATSSRPVEPAPSPAAHLDACAPATCCGGSAWLSVLPAVLPAERDPRERGRQRGALWPPAAPRPRAEGRAGGATQPGAGWCDDALRPGPSSCARLPAMMMPWLPCCFSLVPYGSTLAPGRCAAGERHLPPCRAGLLLPGPRAAHAGQRRLRADHRQGGR